MRFTGSEYLTQRADNPAVAAVLMTVAVRADAVTAGNIRLILNRPRLQQRLPVQRAVPAS